MTVGQRMKARRKELGISADNLALSVGVSRSTIFRYEKGDIEKISGDKLVPIANALFTTPAYLMGWDSEAESVTAQGDDPRLEGLVASYHRLNDEGQTKLTDYAEDLVSSGRYIKTDASRQETAG